MKFFKYCGKLYQTWRLILILLCYISFLTGEEVKPKLSQNRSNIYSQFGEDSIIKNIFEVIGSQSKVCIEFGAWDGFYLSNTANLWVNQGWKGILIECDKNKFDCLVQNVKKYNCIPILKKVGIEPENSLEAILEENSLKDQIDLLSIDIDSDDYYIFQNLANLKPRVIVCEYNPTMPAHFDIYPEYGKNYMGCSVGALVRIGKEKGYTLIALTDCNCFFVKNEEFGKFSNYETSLEKIRIDRYLRYVITNYSGNQATITSEDFIDSYGLGAPLEEKILGFINKIN